MVVGESDKLTTELAKRFETYRPVQLALAPGDRIRITAGGKTKDGKHRLDVRRENFRQHAGLAGAGRDPTT